MKRIKEHTTVFRMLFNQYHHVILTGLSLLFIAVSITLTGCDVMDSDNRGEEQERIEALRSTIDYSGLNAIYNNDANASSASMDKAEKHKGLATLRRATAQYHDVDAAIEDGFVQVAPCQENPEGEGGLGIPFLNPDRLDGIIDPSEPEVLFYEPQKNGRLRLIGVEPVVPIDLWTEDNPPSLFGHEFHRNEADGLYGLHIWIWKKNPVGTITFWHTDLSCEYAD